MEQFCGEYNNPERVMLLEEPKEAFFHRVKTLSLAQEEIILTSFLIRSGTSGDIIVGALLCAANRGVKVKILNDAVIGRKPSYYLNVLSAHENIDVYLFNQFEFFKPLYLNSSLHDKYMVMDKTFVILGGRNIEDRDFDPDCFDGKVSLDREVLVYNTDSEFNGSIASVREYFKSKINSDRAFLQRGKNRNGGWQEQQNQYVNTYMQYKERHVSCNFDYYSNTIRVNKITLVADPFHSARKESTIARHLVMLAQKSCTIIAQSPYVVLTNKHFKRFAEAVRDKDFTILTNSLASTPNLPAFSSYYIDRKNLLTTGVNIYEYQSVQASLHGKTYLFDGRLTAIGSFNINERSIRFDAESMLMIEGEEFHDVTLKAIKSQISQSLRVGKGNKYDLSSGVEKAQVSLGKRILYVLAGCLLRVFRFMF